MYVQYTGTGPVGKSLPARHLPQTAIQSRDAEGFPAGTLGNVELASTLESRLSPPVAGGKKSELWPRKTGDSRRREKQDWPRELTGSNAGQ